MRLIDADELMEHVYRDRLDSRELIAKMVIDAPTVQPIGLQEMSGNELTAMARKEKVQIEIRLEPDGYGNVNKTITIQPWEEYHPYCPKGVPIVHVKEGGGT